MDQHHLHPHPKLNFFFLSVCSCCIPAVDTGLPPPPLLAASLRPLLGSVAYMLKVEVSDISGINLPSSVDSEETAGGGGGRDGRCWEDISSGGGGGSSNSSSTGGGGGGGGGECCSSVFGTGASAVVDDDDDVVSGFSDVVAVVVLLSAKSRGMPNTNSKHGQTKHTQNKKHA